MTGEWGAEGVPRAFTDLELAWTAANLTELRRDVAEPRLLYGTLVVAFVIGLAAHVGGYLLKLGATTPPLGLGADLLYTLGWALWTGAVVVAFTQIFPETKRRQIARWLADYEAAQRDSARAGNASASGNSGAPAAS
jgi:hypothetical protein